MNEKIYSKSFDAHDFELYRNIFEKISKITTELWGFDAHDFELCRNTWKRNIKPWRWRVSMLTILSFVVIRKHRDYTFPNELVSMLTILSFVVIRKTKPLLTILLVSFDAHDFELCRNILVYQKARRDFLIKFRCSRFWALS